MNGQLVQKGLGCVLVMGFAVLGCGDDGDDGAGGGPTGATGGQGGSGASTGGLGGTGNAAGGGALGGAGGATGGSGGGIGGSGGGGQLGCVEDPGLCRGRLMCCAGVPYPPEGICLEMCELDSDRDIKHDVQPTDVHQVLDTLATMRIARWRYDAAPDVVHMGPMAQDFHAAFGLGGSDRTIASVDEGGVTMAAIQALYDRVETLRAENEERKEENLALRDELTQLRAAGCPDRGR